MNANINIKKPRVKRAEKRRINPHSINAREAKTNNSNTNNINNINNINNNSAWKVSSFFSFWMKNKMAALKGKQSFPKISNNNNNWTTTTFQQKISSILIEFQLKEIPDPFIDSETINLDNNSNNNSNNPRNKEKRRRLFLTKIPSEASSRWFQPRNQEVEEQEEEG